MSLPLAQMWDSAAFLPISSEVQSYKHDLNKLGISVEFFFTINTSTYAGLIHWNAIQK